MRLYLASNNPHKAEELGAMLAAAGSAWEVRLARELVPGIAWDESGETFLANARIKAEALRRHTDAAVLADDSGLVVQALGGAPGVHSSRYAGKDGDDAANNAKLLQALSGVPAPRRQAKFVCTLYYVAPGGAARSFTGECPGSIAFAPKGAHGFGYDPLFLVDGAAGQTMAELPAAAKNALSHRRRAFDAFVAYLKRVSSDP
jgi:XTP/dITP diphosphohydrolase